MTLTRLLGVLIVVLVPTLMLAWSVHTGGWRDTLAAVIGGVTVAVVLLVGFGLATGVIL